jgi:hypothetical protein
MSTTVRVRLVRQLAPGAFTDLTPSAWELWADDEHGWMQVHFTDDLTAAQIEAVQNRCESVNDNGAELRRRARAALVANRTYLLNPAPTAGEVRDQVAALTRQMNAVVRFVLEAYDGTE